MIGDHELDLRADRLFEEFKAMSETEFRGYLANMCVMLEALANATNAMGDDVVKLRERGEIWTINQ